MPMLFNLDFANSTILSGFFFFLLIINLYLLNPEVPFFNPIVELVIPMEMPSKEAKAEIEIHPITVEAKIRKLYKHFCAF